MLIIGAEAEIKKISRYDFKTIKVRPLTYKRLIKFKASIESEEQELHSFDDVINHMLDILEVR